MQDNYAEVDSQTALENQLRARDIVLVYFYTTSDPQCRKMGPILNSMTQRFNRNGFAKIRCDEYPHLAEQYGIQVVPTFMIFNRGVKVAQYLGSNDQMIQHMLERYSTV